MGVDSTVFELHIENWTLESVDKLVNRWGGGLKKGIIDYGQRFSK